MKLDKVSLIKSVKPDKFRDHDDVHAPIVLEIYVLYIMSKQQCLHEEHCIVF